MWYRLAIAVALTVPSVARGQGVPGTNLTVDIRVSAITMRGDTTGVHYRLWNHLDSREDLFGFTVDAPGPVVRIPRPEPRADWIVGTNYRGRSVADWGTLGRVLPPGAESPDLWFEAVGLPGVVTAWIGGYFPPPPLTAADTNPVVRPSDPLVESSIRGSTLGVVPKPADSSPEGLILRLRALVDTSCADLGWITNRGVCNSLRGKLERASASLAGGRREAAAGQLRAFVQELEAQHGPQPGKHVSDNAYWLLKVNAEYVLALL